MFDNCTSAACLNLELFRAKMERVFDFHDENSCQMFEGENPRGFITFRTKTQFLAALRNHRSDIEVYDGEFAELRKLREVDNNVVTMS
jgi:hypothetical protein